MESLPFEACLDLKKKKLNIEFQEASKKTRMKKKNQKMKTQKQRDEKRLPSLCHHAS